MVNDIKDINPLYDDNLLLQITSELKKEKNDIEELSEVLKMLIDAFQGSAKSDISNSVKLKVRLRNLDDNYRKLFFNLINIALNESQKGSFIVLDYNKIYHFANSDQIHDISVAYTNILKNRGENGNFTEKEFENFITKCANVVNEIVSVIIIKPNTDLLVQVADVMGVDEVV